MTYPTLDSINATNDISELLVYINSITGGVAMPSVLVAFFLVAFIGSAFLNMRFKGIFRFDFCFAAAGFVTFGMAVIMSMKNGLLNPAYLMISLGVAILGVIILYLSSKSPED